MKPVSKFSAIVYDTLLEVRDRKIFYLYWAVTLILVLVFLLIPDFKINNVNLFDNADVGSELIRKAYAAFFDGFFGFMIFLMVFGAAGLMPSYLGKGRIELALSKPIDRYRLAIMKFAAVYLIMIALLAATTIIVYLVLSIRLGSFTGHFFLGLLLAFLQFFAVYAIVFFLGVASNSSALSIMGYFIIRVGSDLLAGREIVYRFIEGSVWRTILDGLYHILPKIGEMASNYVPLMEGQGLDKTYPVYSTVGISVVLFLAAILIFNRRDY
jgi:ABC-type transport system involved in multi-copper enzyme maturation permease subunit